MRIFRHRPRRPGPMETKRADKVALVTGANKGIGLETSRQLAGRGFTVLLGGRDATALETARAALSKEGIAAHAIVVDMNDRSAPERVKSEIETRFGRLDVLVNNAGVMIEGEWFGNRTSAVSAETLRTTFETN